MKGVYEENKLFFRMILFITLLFIATLCRFLERSAVFNLFILRHRHAGLYFRQERNGIFSNVGICHFGIGICPCLIFLMVDFMN